MGLSRHGATNDFSAIARRYDATRDLPEAMLVTVYDRLISHGVLTKTGFVVDAGSGTGQASLPLAARGYEVFGCDVSLAMAAVARGKCRPGWRATYAVADVRALPLRDAAADAIVVSKLFMHVGHWETACRELLRVLRPGGALIHIAERGAFGNAVRKHFTTRADALGFTERFPGPRDAGTVAEFLAAQGCTALPLDTADLRWEKRIKYSEILGQFGERLFAEFWHLPEAVYRRLLAETEAWVEAQPQGRETVERLTPFLAVGAFRKPGGRQTQR